MEKDNLNFNNLRKKYPEFAYRNYSYRIKEGNLKVSFFFEIEPNICFQPEIVVKNVDQSRIEKIGERVLDNLIFHLGLIEMVSYWKATCSPIIKIQAGCLDKKQIAWWKDLIIKGMGQFFYENKIDFRPADFLKIIVEKEGSGRPAKNLPLSKNKVLTLIGGGKDSIVTLEILKKTNKEIACLGLNPTKAAAKIMKTGCGKNPIIISRKIDKNLLKLNQKGFLNGHTPFSAYLAFLSSLAAVLFNAKYAAVSNEKSSNEGNLSYLGKTVNHQWSKSFEFEEKFRKYSKKYLLPDFEYFSFLRPLYEIQIAGLFSMKPQYFGIFLSCNEAQKTASGREKPAGKWCGRCSKCLFVFAVLYPFLEEKHLLKIFKKNLFKDKNLLPVMKQLIGERGFKPFECVGTKKESLAAFYLSWRKHDNRPPLPFLLDYFQKKVRPKHSDLAKEGRKILNHWNKRHNLPGIFEKILRQETLERR